MSTQIQTTAGEVLAACERIIPVLEERREAVLAAFARQNEEAKRNEKEHNQRVLTAHAQHGLRLAEWTELPFYKRWFEPRPEFEGVEYKPYRYLMTDYGFAWDSALKRATHLRAALSGKPPFAKVFLDSEDAVAIGLGGDIPTADL